MPREKQRICPDVGATLARVTRPHVACDGMPSASPSFMQRTIIVLADATRGRLFTFDRSDEVDGLRESLTERADLVNPARRSLRCTAAGDSRCDRCARARRLRSVPGPEEAARAQLAQTDVRP